MAFWAAVLFPVAVNCAEKKVGASRISINKFEILRNVPVELSASEEAEVDKMVLPVPPNWAGDFEGIHKRQIIRILVPYSKTFFYVDRGHQGGADYELGKALELWLNKRHPLNPKNKPWKVFFIPVRRDQLLTELVAGKGDIAGGGLTITDGRKKNVDFSAPFAKGVSELVVTGPYVDKISTLEELAGKEVTVRASSSYYEHLVAINVRFKKQGLAPIKIIAADEWLESEDILEMVNAGLIKITVVDRYLARTWKPLFKDIQFDDSVKVAEDGDVAWAIRKENPQLKKVLSAFMAQHKIGTTLGNIIGNRYAQDEKRVLNATSEAEMRKFRRLVDLFRQHGKNYDFDYLMLMAQGFQESRLNQKQRSAKGAVGIMQLLPSTAADPAINIPNVEKDANRNIEAGTKYLRLLADTYVNDPEITQVDRTLMAFAAYNAGPGNLRKFRRLAEKSGKDPNVWFQNVEYGAARIVGLETVKYVSNIYKYYLAYKLAVNRNKAVGKGESL